MTHSTCPICGRDRTEVAKSTHGGVQVALGKRTSCCECGHKVLMRRDERAAARLAAQSSAESYARSVMSQCRVLAATRDRLRDEVLRETRKLESVRGMSIWRRLVFVLTGQA